MASFVGNFNYFFVLKSHSDQFIGSIVSLKNLRPIYFNPFFGNLFLEFFEKTISWNFFLCTCLLAKYVVGVSFLSSL